WARVGAGSLPVNPPMAMTAWPPLASSRLAALCDPCTAAAHRVVVFSSALTSAEEVLTPPAPPAAPPGAAPAWPDADASRPAPACPLPPCGGPDVPSPPDRAVPLAPPGAVPLAPPGAVPD